MNASPHPISNAPARRPPRHGNGVAAPVGLWVFLVIAVTAGLYLAGLASWPWDTDEVYSLDELRLLDSSVHRASLSPDSFSARLPRLVPVWYTAQRFVLRFLPVNEWGTRLLSTACAILAALVLFAFGWRRRGWQFALALVVLVDGSQLMISLSQQNRFYGTAVLFLVLAMVAVWSPTPGLKGMLGTLACTLLAVLSHNLLVVVFGLGMVAACVAWPLGWISRSVLARSVAAGLLSTTVYLVHVRPLAGVWTGGKPGAGFSGTGPLPSFVAQVGVPTLALALFGLALALVLPKQRKEMGWWAGLAGGSLAFVAVVPWVMPVWNPRYGVLLVLPFWCMAAFAMEFVARRLRSTRAILLWYSCVLLLLAPKLVSHYLDGSRHDYREAARVVADTVQDGVPIFSNAEWEVRYYLPAALRERVLGWNPTEPLPPSECLIILGSNVWDATARFPGRRYEVLAEISRRRFDEISHMVRVYRVAPHADAGRSTGS